MTGQVQIRNDELVDLLKADFINCWVPVGQSALGAPAAAVVFAGIPATFRALCNMFQARSDLAAATFDDLGWQANGAALTYDYGFILGSVAGVMLPGGVLGAANGLCGRTEAAGSTANQFASGLALWPGYARADCFKTCVTTTTTNFNALVAATVQTCLWTSQWRDNAAITQLAFFPVIGANFVAGTQLALYGIL